MHIAFLFSPIAPWNFFRPPSRMAVSRSYPRHLVKFCEKRKEKSIYLRLYSDCDFFCLDLFSFLKRLPCGNGLVSCIYHSNDLVSSSYPMPVQCEFILTFLVDVILKNNTFEKYQKFCTFK